MLSKIVLWLTALVFIVYGTFILFAPQVPAGLIGFVLTNADARIEMIAMYGGLEIGVGLFCLLGALRQEYEKSSLMFILIVIGGLAISRLCAFALSSGSVTSYTYSAIAYESITFILTVIALVQFNQTNVIESRKP